MGINAVDIQLAGAQAQDVNEWRAKYDFAQTFDLTVAATTNGDSIDLGGPTVMSILLTADTLTGTTPTLDVKFQTRANANESWVDAQAYTQLTAAGAERKRFIVDRYVRPVVALGGTTPAATGSLVGNFMK